MPPFSALDTVVPYHATSAQHDVEILRSHKKPRIRLITDEQLNFLTRFAWFYYLALPGFPVGNIPVHLANDEFNNT